MQSLYEILDLDRYCQTLAERKLVAATLELLEERPFNEISVLDIVERSHQSKTSFYNLFENKEALAVFLFDIVARAVWEKMARAIDAEPQWREKPRAAVRTYVDLCLSYPRTARFLIIDSAGGITALDQSRLNAHAAFAQLVASRLGFEHQDEKTLHLLSTAIVGAANEVVIDALLRSEKGKIDREAEAARLINFLHHVILQLSVSFVTMQTL